MRLECPLSIPSNNGHQLNAVLTEPAPGPVLVIICHGFTGSKTGDRRLLVSMARDLAAHGISALRFDFMGSGDSSGEFSDMTPNTEIEDLKNVVRWALVRGYQRIGLLGHSLGGAVVFCAAEQLGEPAIRALVGWSTLPAFEPWHPRAEDLDTENPMATGPAFFTDMPAVDVPEAFCRLANVPRLQVQGDHDNEGFVTTFRVYFEKAGGVKKHFLIEGADHCFTRVSHRRLAIAVTTGWFHEHLNASL